VTLLLPLHGLGSRQDLPLPFPAVVGGAVVVLLVSFGVLAFAWRTSRWSGHPGGRALPRLSRFIDSKWTRGLVAALGLFAFAWVGMALWFGQDRVTNPVFGFTYVWVWVGLVPLSLLLGPVWRTLNPLRTLHHGMVHLGLPADGFRPLSASLWQRLGQYPAALALIGFGWLELVQPDNNTLAVLQGWWLAWVIGCLGGAVVFGERWLAASDPFEVYATTVARASWWQRPLLVNPLRNLSTSTAPHGTWAVVTALLGITAFDGFTGTTWWVRTTQTSALPGTFWGTLGLLGMVALVGVTLALGARGLGRLTGRTFDRIAASVIPIVIGYAVAHYLSLLVLEGQRTLINLSDPLGLGWNTFGTAELGINLFWLETPAITALIQLIAIVGGHVIGVLVAHEVSLTLLPPKRRTSGQLAMLLVMIGYTCGGLVLLFSP